MKTVLIWVYDDCLGSAVTAAMEVLSTANAVWRAEQAGPLSEGRAAGAGGPLFRWQLRAASGAKVVTSAGIELAPDGALSTSGADAIFLPGLACERGSQRLIARLPQFAALYPALRAAHRRGVFIAANCSATFLVAEAGLLRARRATTTWWLARAFQGRYPEVRLDANELLTEHDGIACSGAATAYLNLALHLVRRLAGPAIAAACARLLLVDANRVSQAAFMSPTLQEQLAHSDAMIARAEVWIRHNLRRAFLLRELARAMAVSERTLIRRFHAALETTPRAYAQSVRMEVGKTLLETSTLCVDDIAARVGYGDVGAFRRIFKRHTGTLPADYRRRFARRTSSPTRPSSSASAGASPRG